MSTNRERFQAEMPGHFFLDADEKQIEAYLIEQGVVPRKRLMKKGATVEQVELLRLSEMDFSVRVHFGEGAQPHGPTLLMKQSRPWVERRPELAAPVSRSRAEAGFLKMMSRVSALSEQTPQLLHHDAANHILVLRDFGRSTSLQGVYQGDSLNREVNSGEQLLTAMVAYLNTLHGHFLLNPPVRPVVNKGMRKYVHALMFDSPFRENKLQLDSTAQKRVNDLGERYIDFKAGGTLLHGNFSFGNMRICDDERSSLLFTDAVSCITGPPEFDFGILAAHLHLAGHASAVDQARELYSGKLDWQLWKGFAGVEIVRRISETADLSNVSLGQELLLKTAKNLLMD